ncbi:hypothetical protein HNY73_007664 [Argiope bruennichi]|uniref:Uncharacterized protein n=1 Tax=Argiope bruennichi TaxID=94029 RepID=A0A8T0FEK7_ARGBR|nr:hypothetical protein HNY73_007664 [Argiope bruennichi]
MQIRYIRHSDLAPVEAVVMPLRLQVEFVTTLFKKCLSSLAMEGDGCSDDSRSCRSAYSNKTFYNGKSCCASEFIRSIQDHCRLLKNWSREINSAVCKKCQINKRLDGDCSPSEKAGLLKRLDDLNRLIKCNEEKLKNAKPCINKGCRTHDGDRNLCAYISTSQERMLRLNYTASTFLDTLQQMIENKLEHTAQYLDDYDKLKKIQADIRHIANELDDVAPGSIDNCERHTPDNVRQPLQTENLEHTTEREIAVMDIDNTPEKNNKKNTNSDENYQMVDSREFPDSNIMEHDTDSLLLGPQSACDEFRKQKTEVTSTKKRILNIQSFTSTDPDNLGINELATA